ncbi:MAG: hypothetical protein H0W96_01085 [Solirubrobacterales bacterium]|nr:hypothetical protein [Solirubrobacterales bacterium]
MSDRGYARVRAASRRAEDLDVVLGRDGGQGRGVVLVELCDGGHEALEVGGRARDEPAGGLVADAVGVRHAAQREHEVAGLRNDPAAGRYSETRPART